MATARPNPLLIPTLTEVIAEGFPALDPKSEITPEILAERVLQIVQPQIEEIIKTAVIQALSEQN